MATPANRVPVRIARGTKANLDTAVAAGDLKEGEVCYATDENSIYVIEGGVLTQAGADLSAASIDALSDVDTSTITPTDGQILTWNNTDSEWQPATPAIDALSDVDTSTAAPTDGQVLTWNNTDSEWQPATPAAGGGASELNELTDVTTIGPGDQYYSDVAFIVQGDSIADASPNNVTMASSSDGNGGIQISNSITKFGGGSLDFATSGFDIIDVSANTVFDFSQDTNWTYEFWAYHPTAAGVPNLRDFFRLGKANSNHVALRFQNNKLTVLWDSNTRDSDAITWTLDTWHHVAFVRDGNTLRFYFDGSEVSSSNNDLTGQSFPTPTTDSAIGGSRTTSFPINVWEGYFEGIRLTRNVARYTGSTYTLPTALPELTAPSTPTDGQVLSWVDANSQWEPATVAGGATAIDGLTDVDTSTTPPSDGQVLTWVAADSEWQPADAAGGGGGASTLADLTDTDGIPVLSTTSRFSGRWNENAAEEIRPGVGNWAFRDTVSRVYFSVTDADGQDVTSGYNSVLTGLDSLQIATDSAFTNLVYDGLVSSKGSVDSSPITHYWFTGNPTIPDLDGTGTVYIRVFNESISPSVADNKVLVWDQSSAKWVPGDPTIPEKGLDDLTNVSSGVSVSLMNFDLANGTGTNFEPLDDEVATAADGGLQWVGRLTNDGVSNAQVKFGSGALDLFTNAGLIEWPATNNTSTYAIWSPRWALGDSDFTMEFWWYYPSGQGVSDRTFLHWADNVNYDSNAIEWFYKHDGLATEAAFKVIYTEEGQTHTEVTFTIGSFITTDAWHHLALCRDGANLRAFLDGTQVDATHDIGTKVIRTPNYAGGDSRFRLGDSNRENRPCRGYIDGWSYAKTAYYTANFTAPAAAPSTAPIPEGSILVYENGLWQSSADYVSVATLKTAVNDGAGDYAAFKAYIDAL